MMKNAIVHYCENLLHDDHQQRPLINGISYDTISMEDALELEKEFLEEEVRCAINELGKDKAPGLDGFNIAFFQSCWEVIKGHIMGLFSDFHTKGVFQKKFECYIFMSPTQDGRGRGY